MPKQCRTAYPNAIVPPVERSTSFAFASTDEVKAYHEGRSSYARYARYENTNWQCLEEELAALDGCDDCAVFPSGMSAIASTFLALCSSGDHVVFGGKGYRNITQLCTTHLPRLNIECSPVAFDPAAANDEIEAILSACKKNTKIVFLETPSNPHLYLVDVSRLRQALAPDITLIIDSTIATPINFQPARHGADLVIHSIGKYVAGHGNAMGGSVAGQRELISTIKAFRNVWGSIMAPDVAALIHQGLKTLRLRVEDGNRCGMRVAQWLDGHPKVRKVFYPGLETHPHAKLGRTIMTGFGGLVTFELDATLDQAASFCDEVTIPYMCTGFGAVDTFIELSVVRTFGTDGCIN